ncbi:MAG: Uma2 family endonuclease [Burkholderiales bacterium]|nr:Uma2 family endonuclease [Burkholderiales bacterium]
MAARTGWVVPCRAGADRRCCPATPQAELLLIEVADSSARYDREVKLPLYARHGVAHVWLVDLEAGRGRLRFYSRLEGGEYSDISSTEHPGVTPLPGLKGMAIDLGLLG